MSQNFHLTARAFLGYTKIQAVLQSKNHFFNVGYCDQRPHWSFDPGSYGKDYVHVFKQYYIFFLHELKELRCKGDKSNEYARPKVYGHRAKSLLHHM